MTGFVDNLQSKLNDSLIKFLFVVGYYSWLLTFPEPTMVFCHVQSLRQDINKNFIFIAALRGRYYYSHILDEERAVQRVDKAYTFDKIGI